MKKRIIKTDRIETPPVETVPQPETPPMTVTKGGAGALSTKQVITTIVVIVVVAIIIAVAVYLFIKYKKSPVKALPVNPQ